MCGFAPSGEQFFWCYFGNFLIAIACTGYGYFISALAPNVKAANTIAPSLLIPLFLLSGFFIPATEVPVYFIPFQYISWFYYGVELLVINQWHGTDFCISLNISEIGLPLPGQALENRPNLLENIFCKIFTPCLTVTQISLQKTIVLSMMKVQHRRFYRIT